MRDTLTSTFYAFGFSDSRAAELRNVHLTFTTWKPDGDVEDDRLPQDGEHQPALSIEGDSEDDQPHD